MTKPASTETATWRPALGAWPEQDGYRFWVWAPTVSRVTLVISGECEDPQQIAMESTGDGGFGAFAGNLPAGSRYAYLLDGDGPFPDPASRQQPDGVHGLSATVDPNTFEWSDAGWRGLDLRQAVFYELHVGTFTPAGTFAGVVERLPYLADLGVTVVELMPVAAFPGTRNWGYDGVSLFAPAGCYGEPDDLRRLVDAAHRCGLAVVLDVVYNHFGPDGAYTLRFSPFYASRRHQSPWGAAVNFDGEHGDRVRAFCIENALHWLHEYHLDGLRLDATHAIVDDSPRHVIAELAARARESVPERKLLVVAEDCRNLAAIVQPQARGGWGCDAVWADDFHHVVRRLTAGDRDGYFQDFAGDLSELATTIRRGWLYVGQRSAYLGGPRGTEPTGLSAERMVVCLQNHDQVGNRALGERLNHQVDASVFRAVSVVLLCAPESPLLFMGQEWAASTPFLYFTDHGPELGRLVTAGRRKEFARFAAFRDDAAHERIPDPQAVATFEASRLRWDETTQPAHDGMLRLYRRLLHLRRSTPALQAGGRHDAVALDRDTLVMERTAAGETLLVVARLRGRGEADLRKWADRAPRGECSLVLSSEDASFSGSPAAAPPVACFATGAPSLRFPGPAAVILRLT